MWYQYTKIFAGPRSLKPLIVAVLIGIPIGQVVRHYFPHFVYRDVVGLGVATWTAAILTLYYARITSRSKAKSQYTCAKDGVYHAFHNPGKDLCLSQDELGTIYHNLRVLQDEDRYQIDPQTHPGLEIKTIFLHTLRRLREQGGTVSGLILDAFPEATELLEMTISAFERGTVAVDCVPVSAMVDGVSNTKAVSLAENGKLRIIVGCEKTDVHRQQSGITSFCEMYVLRSTN